MYVTPEQVLARNKAGVEAMISAATTQFEAIEKFASVNANAVKAAFEDTIANARALAGAKDVQELVNLQNSFAQSAIEKAIAYSKSVYAFATQTSGELAKAAERRAGEWNENVVSILDQASKNAPAGTDVALAALRQTLAAANSAYDSFSKVAKQTTEIAEGNVAAAAETVKGLGKARKTA